MQHKEEKRKMSFLNARVTSTISISLVLFILGVVVMISILGTQLTTYIKENMGFSIILNDKASKSDMDKFNRILDVAPYIRAMQFVSKDDALKELEFELGENPTDLLGFNPLQSSIEIKLTAEYANPDSLAWIEKSLSENKTVVSNIICQRDVVQIINDNIIRAEFILLILSIILMVISFALISNTIRLMAYSKRFTIHTMRLVGATAGFIRRPFIRSNLLEGLVASFIAIALLGGCTLYLLSEFDNLSVIINLNNMLIVFGSIIVLGVSLTSISAYFAVNRYISMERDDMFYM